MGLLKKVLEQTLREQRQQLIESNHAELSLRRQCELLQINRSTLYYKAAEIDPNDIGLLNEIREIWEQYPFYGYRRITKELKFNGQNINRKRVQRLMQLGGIQATYPGPNTSRWNKLHAFSSLFTEGFENYTTQSGVDDRHYLSANKRWVHVFSGPN